MAIELAVETPVSCDVKRLGVEKWSRGREAISRGTEAFFEWFEQEGKFPCSFCSYFSPRCYLCPLYTGHECAKPWDFLMEQYLRWTDEIEIAGYDEIDAGKWRDTAIGRQVIEMAAMIEAVSVKEIQND